MHTFPVSKFTPLHIGLKVLAIWTIQTEINALVGTNHGCWSTWKFMFAIYCIALFMNIYGVVFWLASLKLIYLWSSVWIFSLPCFLWLSSIKMRSIGRRCFIRENSGGWDETPGVGQWGAIVPLSFFWEFNVKVYTVPHLHFFFLHSCSSKKSFLPPPLAPWSSYPRPNINWTESNLQEPHHGSMTQQ